MWKNEPIRKLVQYIRVIRTPQNVCEKTDSLFTRLSWGLQHLTTVQKVAFVNSTLPSFYEVLCNWTKEYWSFFTYWWRIVLYTSFEHVLVFIEEFCCFTWTRNSLEVTHNMFDYQFHHLFLLLIGFKASHWQYYLWSYLDEFLYLFVFVQNKYLFKPNNV